MQMKYILGWFLAGASAIAFVPASASAQQAAPKIAVANPVQIFTKMKETVDLQERLKKDAEDLKNEDGKRQQEIKDLAGERDGMKPGSDQYQDKNKEILKKSVELKVWRELKTAEAQRQQKAEMRALYEKIQTAIAQVAKDGGYDLVLAEQSPEFPPDLDMITVDTMRMIIAQRNVLYKKDAMDISEKVIITLDATYKH